MEWSSKLSAEIAKYIKGREAKKFDEFDKAANKKRKIITNATQLADWEATYAAERLALEKCFIPNHWLTNASQRAKQIHIVTHVLKFTHSDATGSSIYMDVKSDLEQSSGRPYLTTASLAKMEVDVVGNAAALDIAGFLKLEADGERVLDYIIRNDNAPLQPFAESSEQLSQWMMGFQQVLKSKGLNSHTLAKQIYFPIDHHEYHLLSPLFSSSLAQAIANQIEQSRYSEEAKAARNARKEAHDWEAPTVDYPNVLVQQFGGAKPQNISQLNAARRGKAYLLSCAPPTWNVRGISPPLKVKCIIQKRYHYLVSRQVYALQQYLIGIQEKISNAERRGKRAEYVDNLVGKLLNYAAQLQNLPAGWSVESRLPRAQQLWLDPQRGQRDEWFKQEREQKAWIPEISAAFSHWLTQKLQHKNLTMSDPEYEYFHKLLKRRLRRLEKELEAMV